MTVTCMTKQGFQGRLGKAATGIAEPIEVSASGQRLGPDRRGVGFAGGATSITPGDGARALQPDPERDAAGWAALVLQNTIANSSDKSWVELNQLIHFVLNMKSLCFILGGLLRLK